MSNRSPASRTLVSAALLLAGTLAAARGAVDVEVGNGDKVTGTLSPASEVETFRFRVPKDAVVKVSAKAAKKGPELRVRLFDTNDAEVRVSDGKSVSIAGYVALETGELAVTVTSKDGATVGDYGLAVSWKIRGSYPIAGTLDPAGEATIPFSAEALSKATFAIKKSGGAAVPVFVDVTDPDAAVIPLTTKKLTLPLTGEYSLRYRDAGSAGGAVKGTIKLTAGKRAKRKITLTARSIGAGGAAGDTAFAAVVGPGGDLVSWPVGLSPGDPGFELSGSSVSIPQGALPAGTSIIIATAPALVPPSGNAAGPTVYFGPEGLRFDASLSATITIPLDPAFAGDTSAIRIYTRDARGRITLIDPAIPPGYTFGAGTVSCATSHFSSFRAASTKPPRFVQIETVQTQVGTSLDVCDANDPAPGARVLYFTADGTNLTVSAIRKQVSGNFTRETFVGGGSSSADGTQRLQFAFDDIVTSVAASQDGTLFVATTRQIFSVDTLGLVKRIAGNPQASVSGDGGDPLLAMFTAIQRIDVTPDGGLIYVIDAFRIRVVAAFLQSPQIDAWAGTGVSALGIDDSPALQTTFLAPRDMAAAPTGGLYIVDAGRVRHVNPFASTPVNKTVAGDELGTLGSSGDGNKPRSARFRSLSAVGRVKDPADPLNIFLVVADSQDHTLRIVDLMRQEVRLLAGSHGVEGFEGDLVNAPSLLDTPISLATEGPEGVTFLDADNDRLRKIVNFP